MNIQSKSIFIDVHLKHCKNLLFTKELNKRVSSLSKTVNSCYFSDIDESTIKEYMSNKERTIKATNIIQQHQLKAKKQKKQKYYLKGASDSMLISSMLRTPSLLTINNNNTQYKSTMSMSCCTSPRLFKNSSPSSRLTNASNWNTPKTITKSKSSIKSKQKRPNSSIDDTGTSSAMVLSPLFLPIKKRDLKDKRINFYSQFSLFTRKLSQINIKRPSLIDRSNTIATSNRVKSSKTMRVIEGIASDKHFRLDDDNDEIYNIELNSNCKVKQKTHFSRMLKLQQQKVVMKEIEKLIDYSGPRDYQEEQLERMRNTKKLLLLSKINDSLIYKNIKYFTEKYGKNSIKQK